MSENNLPSNLDDIIRAFLDRSTNDILNIPLNQTIQPTPTFPSNLNIIQRPIGPSNSTNTINTSTAFVPLFGAMPTTSGLAGMSGLGGMAGYVDILERSMQDMGGATKPTAKDTIDNLSIVEVFSDKIQCAICQETIKNGCKAIKLPCPDSSHYFCLGDAPEKCAGIKPWLKENNTCPICRFELPIEEEEKEPKESPESPPPLEPLGEIPQTEPSTHTASPQENFIRNMVRNLLQEEAAFVDDDGFDTREFDEAIQRSLDGAALTEADAEVNAAAEAAVNAVVAEGDIHAMREMGLQNLEKNSDDTENIDEEVD